jgi:transposase
VHFEREQRLEGRYGIETSEKNVTALDAVAMYKQRTEVERGFRRMKDVLSLRPVYHQVEPRVKAHIFVAALALLVQTFLDQRLKEAGVDMSAEEAMQAVETVRYVSFTMNDTTRSGVSAANPRARQVLKALGITELRPPTPAEDEPTVR